MATPRAFRLCLLSLVALFVGVAPAAAVDGVQEINQACAEGDGCFQGDLAGFPVLIAAPGSYRLTGNLAVPDANTTAIEIAASDVSIDMGGFTIRGVTDCAGAPLVCTPSGTGRGIWMPVPHQRATVRNGTVRNMGNAGVELQQGSLAIRLRAFSNALQGIRLARWSAAAQCVAQRNGDDGIRLSGSSTLRDGQGHRNGGIGIYSLGGSAIARSGAVGNVFGFEGFDGVVSQSTGFGNSFYGFFVIQGVAARSAAHSNDSGFRVQSGSGAVSEVTSRSNGGSGLSLDATQGYSAANLSDNGSSTASGGLPLDGNACDGSTTCP